MPGVELGYLRLVGGHVGLSDPGRRRARGDATAAVTLAPAPVATATAAVTTAARGARVAGADAGELLGRLALDVGVLGEPQADPASLLVDLDDGDIDLVALVEDVLDRADSLARLHVGDVKQAIGALGELDECAEVGGLHHLARRVAVADLGVLGHRGDPLRQGVDLVAGGRVEAHRAVVVDVDLGLELLREAADGLAALADQGADLLRVDPDRGDLRRELRELLARAGRSPRPSCRG